MIECNNKLKVPWSKPVKGLSFNPRFETEFRKSQIKNSGFGWWSKTNIPSNVPLRRASLLDGSLFRFENEKELLSTKWNINEMARYGIGHKLDSGAIFFLNPGTMMNHADPSREPSVYYKFPEKGIIEIWTTKAIKKGEEIFNDYEYDFVKCNWYDDLQIRNGNIPISMIGNEINNASIQEMLSK